VQGVGFRYFVVETATRLGVEGYTRNLDDGSVAVYASGSESQLSDLAAALWKGPRYADVRGVEEVEAAPKNCRGFRIRD
jgi:acylphosphatase